MARSILFDPLNFAENFSFENMWALILDCCLLLLKSMNAQLPDWCPIIHMSNLPFYLNSGLCCELKISESYHTKASFQKLPCCAVIMRNWSSPVAHCHIQRTAGSREEKGQTWLFPRRSHYTLHRQVTLWRRLVCISWLLLNCKLLAGRDCGFFKLLLPAPGTERATQ